MEGTGHFLVLCPKSSTEADLLNPINVHVPGRLLVVAMKRRRLPVGIVASECILNA